MERFFATLNDWSIPLLAPRHEVRRAARTACQVVRERDFVLLGEQTLDLSRHGLLVESRRPAHCGDEVLISLQIPGGSTWIDASGVVRRVRWQDDRVRALAIEFAPLGLVDRAMLDASLQRRPARYEKAPQRRDYAGWVAGISA